jgi:DNA polymerase V
MYTNLTPNRVALVDCNNFYVSCERVFNPKLRNQGVVVLSNNDGCIISRSQEAKDAGIRMGALFHEVKRILPSMNIIPLSSNYPMYGDMSMRVMETISTFSPEVEVYSIDEAFADLTHVSDNSISDYGSQICDRVFNWTGIPVSVGIAPTKTLAKAAALRAKKIRNGPRVHCVNNADDIIEMLKATDVSDLWGIGRSHSAKLRNSGIENGLQLTSLPDQWIRSALGATGLAVARELRAIPCGELEVTPPPRKGISCTRTFPGSLISIEKLRMAVASFATRVAEKIRASSLLAGNLTLFISTGPFAEKKRSVSETHVFSCATEDTILITEKALKILEKIHAPCYEYKRAGILISSLVAKGQGQMKLFETGDNDRTARLMTAIDDINSQMGRRTLRLCVEGFDNSWRTKREMLSPRYTTCWEELPLVR